MNIGLLGCGTVGGGVYEIARSLEEIHVRKVLKRHAAANFETERIEDITRDPEIDLVAEAMGGLHPAYEYAVQAIEAGKHFVTANKLLVSVYGDELTRLAREKGVAFLYGAACGGGIAYLANLEIARNVDRITALGGILNGTTNYILDAMQRRDMDYAQALREAQELGYAERDPSSDVDGLDTMRKLILACAVGFDAYVRAEEIPTFGISSILPEDIIWARARGLVLRLCACAEKSSGGLSAYVQPTLVPAGAAESAVSNNLNYAWYRGERCGLMSYTGQGAGRMPTADNMLRDVRSIAVGHRYMTSERCAEAHPDNGAARCAYYLRVPAGAAVPEAWIKNRRTAGDWDFIETYEVSIAEMHARMAETPAAFFAGMREE